ncbi:MAG TPA: hypothetical protein VEC93_17555, partial [Anaerolineae bacterium]|nr:hypothetical protein [Anaerolineae bacterium]
MIVADDTNNLFRRSYSRGLLVFGYGLVWLAGLGLGFRQIEQLFGPGETTTAILLAVTAASALAGGIGGVTAMLQRLARHLSVEQDFRRQSLLPYLLQPLTGLIAGVISLYLIALPGALLVNFAVNRTLSLADVTGASTFVALQLLLAWIAGFYQLAGLAKLKSRAKSIPPAPAPSDKALVTAPVSTEPDHEAPLAFKIWFEQRQRMIRWSLTWGLAVFFYGLVWLIGLIATFLLSESLFPTPDESRPPLINLMAAGWPAVVAGGIGGVVGMLNHLYRHVSFDQDFDRQHVMSYVILPITGSIMGGIMYLFLASGYLSLQSLFAEAGAPPVVDSPTLVAIYIILGWLAGFNQQSLDGLIRRLNRAVIAFFRFCLGLLSFKLLWDRAARDEALAEV